MLLVYNNRGFGLGWLINHLLAAPSSRIPKINLFDDLLLLCKRFVLQDLAIERGLQLGVDTLFQFNKNFVLSQKNILYNEYVSFLLNSLGAVDSSRIF